MTKWTCGAADRLDPDGMSCHVVVFGERQLRHTPLLYMAYYNLQWRENTPISEQGCADTTGRSGRRAHLRDPILGGLRHHDARI